MPGIGNAIGIPFMRKHLSELKYSFDRKGIIIFKDSAYYLAFPSMTIMPNGYWLLTFTKGLTHSDAKATMLSVSSDYGKTWSESYEVFHLERPANTRLGGYLSTIGNRIFLIVEETTRHTFMYYSDDNAQTWSSAIEIKSVQLNNGGYVHGNIIEDNNGDLLCAAWGLSGANVYCTCEILKSVDNGLTWSDLAYFDNPLKDSINNDGGGSLGWTSEPALVKCSNDDLLLYTRGNGLFYRSVDNGSSWDAGTSLGHDLGLPSILNYGSNLYILGRYRYLMGTIYYPADITNFKIIYRKSIDNGLTWGDPVTIDEYGDCFEGSGGYASAISYSGKIAIVYFTNDGFHDLYGSSLIQDNAPYLRLIQDIFDDVNFGDETLTNVKFDYEDNDISSLEVYGKKDGEDYVLLGLSTHDVIEYLVEAGDYMTFKCIVTKPGSVKTYIKRIFIPDPRAARVINNMKNDGEEPNEVQKINLHTLITALRANSLFETQFDALWIMRTKGEKSSKMNLIRDAFNIIGVNNDGILNFSNGKGYSSDGSHSYINPVIGHQYLKLLDVTDAYMPTPSSCFGFKISGTISNTGNQDHGYFTNTDKYFGMGSQGEDGFVALCSDRGAANQRIIGYNNISKNSNAYISQCQNELDENVVSANRVTYSKTSRIYFLARFNGTDAENFIYSSEVYEVFWLGKYISRANFIIFQGIIDNYITGLAGDN